jgi:hypothetical protein
MSNAPHEMPPHWFAAAIEDAVMTKNSTQIARTCGTIIANSHIIVEAIDAAIAADALANTGRPALAHAIRQAIANEIGQYPGLH